MRTRQVPFEAGLHAVGDGVHAYLQPDGEWGLSNCGLVASQGEALLFDTQYTLEMTRTLLGSISRELPGVAVRTVVNSHANGDHTFGNQLLPGAEIIASATTADHLAHELTPQQMTELLKAPPATPVMAYLHEHFSRFDFSGIEVVGPTRTFSDRLELVVGETAVELWEIGPAHTHGDVIMHVPGEGVVFAGDVLFVGGHLIVWSGSVSGHIRALDRILASGATIFVPGHGPVVGRAEVVAIRDVLSGIAAAATEHARAGTPLLRAAEQVMAEFHSGWAFPERVYTAVAAAYGEAGVEGVPTDPFGLVEGMAALAAADADRSG